MDQDKAKRKASSEESEKLTTPTSDGDKAAELDIDDGKQSPEESKLLQDASAEVKFIAADVHNGDAKIDMASGPRVTFSGMGKEELMKFANDPFWVRMRWFLFILFWLTWLSMLAGAIAIIFLAPKCPAAAPREWWEKGPLVPIDVDTFSADGTESTGTLKALTAGLDSLKSMGMTGLVLSSILKEDPDDKGIVDFQDVDTRFGSLDDFKEFSTKAKAKGIKLMLTLTPNHSSRKHEWFKQSLLKVEPYTDYYVWHEGKGLGQAGKKGTPNNWLSMSGGSAWEWNGDRSEFYLHQFAVSQPDLNFRNPNVITAFKEVLLFWRGLGVSGFRLGNASYLLEDKDFKDEPVAPTGDQKPGSTHTDYGFYRHIYTKDLLETVTLLAKIKQPLLAEGTDNGVFAADLDGIPETLKQYYGSTEGSVVVELPLFNVIKQLPSPAEITATQLRDAIENWLTLVPNATWPNWLLTSGMVPKDLEGGFNMAMMLLEGTPVSTYGASIPAELSGNLSTVSEERELVHGLALARESPSILYGSMDLRVLDTDVLAYTRKKSGNPGYLVLFNLAELGREVNAKVFDSVPDDVSVQLKSPGFKDDSIQDKGKLKSDAISLPGKSALVLTFVPQKH